MIKMLLLPLMLLLSLSAFGQVNDYKLPDTWSEDFVIMYWYHSSMSGGKTVIRITFDSCRYTNQSNHSKKPKTKAFKVTEADRAAILKKLAELKADQIKAEDKIQLVHDGWSESFCLGMYCVQGGTSVEMDKENRSAFLEVCRYLEEFAGKKR